MRFMAGFFAALIIGIILIAAFSIASVRGRATVQPAAVERTVIGQAKLWLIPTDREAGVPPPKTEQAILEGGEHYNERCSGCHDLSGDADSSFAKSFYPPISDLLSGRVQAYSDGQLKWIIDNGIRYTGMPGWEKTVNDEDQWEIVYYLRVLNSPEQKERYKQLLQQRGKWKVEVPAGEEEEDQGSGDRTDTEENSREEKSGKSPSTPDDGAAREGGNHENERDDRDNSASRAVTTEARSNQKKIRSEHPTGNNECTGRTPSYRHFLSISAPPGCMT